MSSSSSAAAASAAAEESDAQTLPASLAARLPSHPRALFHSSAATRLMFVGEARSHAPTDALHDFQFDVVHVGQVGQLLHSWGQVFAQIQSAAPRLNPALNPSADPDAWRTFLLQMSRAYRAELETCLLDAAAQLQGPAGADAQLRAELRTLNIALDDYKYQLLLLETCKSLLHLVEIVCLDPHLNLTAQLVDWTHRTLQMPQVEAGDDEDEQEEVVAGAPMRDTEAYWSCVYHLVLQGRLFEALQMLESCTELMGDGSPYRSLMRSVLDAIETVPAMAQQEQRAQHAPQVPVDQFLHSFRAWQSHVQQLRDSDVLAEHPHDGIDLLLAVLLGDEQSLVACAHTNYLELLCANLLYVKPHMQNKSEISALLQRCMEQAEEQWKEERAQRRAADGMEPEEEAEEDDDGSDSLYTPIDTLRYHLLSDDMSAALSVMNSMLDLRFFMAHVVHILDAHGDILHHEEDLEEDERLDSRGRVLAAKPKPLRLHHSAVNDNITLLEFYLISYAESLEAASAGLGGVGGAGSELMWTMAVEYYAACPENGRGYLVNLLRKQSLTLDLARPSTAAGSGAAADGAVEIRRRVDHRKVHRLLALCSRFHLHDEYNHVLTMAGNLCVQQGMDALRAAGASGDGESRRLDDAASFGQAVHWYSLTKMDASEQSQRSGGTASVARASVARMECVAELLLDELLLKPDSPLPQQHLAFQSLVGVLAHVPSSLLIPLDVVAHPEALAPSPHQSTLLSFLGAFYSYRSMWFKMQQAARDIEREKEDRMEAAANDDAAAAAPDAMDDGEGAMRPATLSTTRLASLLAAHAHLHSQCLSLLVSLLRHCVTLLPAQRKYWLVLVQQLVQLMEERAPHLTAAQKRDRRVRRDHAAVLQPAETVSYYQLHHPTYALPAVLPAATAAVQLPLETLTHVQRLLTSLLHSNAAKQYSNAVGGPAGVKHLQQALSSFTTQTIQRHA